MGDPDSRLHTEGLRFILEPHRDESRVGFREGNTE